MATRTFQNVDADFTNTANWSGAAFPVTGDGWRWSWGTQDCTANVTRTTVDPLWIEIVGSYSGSIGSSATPLLVDDVTEYVRINVDGGPTQKIYLSIDSCPIVIVQNTGGNQDACYFMTSATGITEMLISGGKSIRIGAITITTLHVIHQPGKPLPQVFIETGASIGTLKASAGHIKSEAALGTVKLRGTAVLEQIGETTGNITALEVGGNAVALLGGAGFTSTSTETYENGRVDSSQPHLSKGPWTHTNARAAGGVILTKETDIFTNDPVEAGGSIPYAASKDVRVIPSGLGAPSFFG